MSPARDAMLDAFTTEQASRRNNERRLREDVAKRQAERRARVSELEQDIKQRNRAGRPCADQYEELHEWERFIERDETRYPSV